MKKRFPREGAIHSAKRSRDGASRWMEPAVGLLWPGCRLKHAVGASSRNVRRTVPGAHAFCAPGTRRRQSDAQHRLRNGHPQQADAAKDKTFRMAAALGRIKKARRAKGLSLRTSAPKGTGFGTRLRSAKRRIVPWLFPGRQKSRVPGKRSRNAEEYRLPGHYQLASSNSK
jgi:hypothetical protein